MSRAAASGMTTWSVVGAAGAATLGMLVLAGPFAHNHTASAAVLGSPSAIAIQDNGKTFSYPLGAGFSVRLDKEEYPPENLACSPEGIIKKIDVASPAKKWMTSSGFQAIALGECTLTNGNFSVHIQVGPQEGGTATLAGLPSGIRGLITEGPLCAPEGQPCPNVAYQTTVGIYASSSLDFEHAQDKPVASLSANADGHFETTLPPGDYVVRAGLPITSGGASALKCNWARVLVLPHSIAAVSLQCDTGIR